MAAKKDKPTIEELVDKRRELVAQLSEIDAQIAARHGEPRDEK